MNKSIFKKLAIILPVVVVAMVAFISLGANNAGAVYDWDAAYVSQNVPTQLYVNQQTTVTVTMQNLGLQTWSSANGVKLSSQNPTDNLNWGRTRVDLGSNLVHQNQVATFNFTIRAPSNPGTYNFQWRMVKDVAPGGWFGDYTPNVVIRVIANPTPTPTRTPTPTPAGSPVCNISQISGRTIFRFPNPATTPDTWLLAGGSLNEAQVGPYNFSLAAGTYRVTLIGYDDHSTSSPHYQPQESYFLILRNGSTVVAQSGASSDIPDNSDYSATVLANPVTLSGDATSILAQHAAYPTSNPNSLAPVCASFDLISTPTPPPSAPTVDIKANGSDGPITIPYNTQATLSWTSNNATSCTASNAWSGAKTINGSEVTGNLTSSRTYVITCTGPGGSANDSVTVNVGNQPQPPTVDIKANGSDGPVTVAAGSNITLSWTSTNANSCVASDDWTGNKTINGSESSVAQNNSAYTRSNIYVITCTGDAGTAVDQVTVNITPNTPTVDIKANGSDGPVTVAYGTPATLSWTSTNATSCFASNAWSGSKPINGSEVTGNLTYTQTFNITCTGTGGTASDSVTINVQGQQLVTVDIKANGSDGPVTVAYGTPATLSWTSTNATSCTASNAWSGSKVTNGSEVSNNITNTQTYVITCTNGSNSATDSVAVNPQNQQNVTVDIKANGSDGPITIPYNTQVTLSWTSNNATSCTASNAWSGAKTINGSEVTGNLTYSQTYTITCTNSNMVAVDSVTINPQGQQNISVDIKANGSDGPVTIPYNTSATLSWTSNGANSCFASNAWSGNKSTYGTEQTGNINYTQTYTIFCSGNGGTASDSVTIYVQNQQGPTVDIKANGSDGPVTINSGTSANLSWSSNNASYCSANGAWSGNKSTYGTEQTSNLTYAQTYNIVCYGNGGSASDSVTIYVQGFPTNDGIVSIQKYGTNITRNQTSEQTSITAYPGDIIEFTIRVRSLSSNTLNNVIVSDALPAGFTYISGSTKVNGAPAADGVTNDGLNIGTLTSNQEAVIRFRANAGSSAVYSRGNSYIANIAYVKADNANRISTQLPITIYNGSITDISRVPTGTVGSVAIAISLAALLTMMYMGYTNTGIFKQRDALSIVKRNRNDKDKFNFGL